MCYCGVAGFRGRGQGVSRVTVTPLMYLLLLQDTVLQDVLIGQAHGWPLPHVQPLLLQEARTHILRQLAGGGGCDHDTDTPVTKDTPNLPSINLTNHLIVFQEFWSYVTR